MNDSLKKSHSKVSNFKLTLICILGAISFFMFWVGVGLLNKYMLIGAILFGVGLIFSIISFMLVAKFTR